VRAGNAQCALEDEKAHASGDHYAHEELRELLNAERLHARAAYDRDGNSDERSAMVPKVRRAHRTTLCRWPEACVRLSAEVSEGGPRRRRRPLSSGHLMRTLDQAWRRPHACTVPEAACPVPEGLPQH
jgi:hypothetical protein